MNIGHSMGSHFWLAIVVVLTFPLLVGMLCLPLYLGWMLVYWGACCVWGWYVDDVVGLILRLWRKR